MCVGGIRLPKNNDLSGHLKNSFAKCNPFWILTGKDEADTCKTKRAARKPADHNRHATVDCKLPDRARAIISNVLSLVTLFYFYGPKSLNLL